MSRPAVHLPYRPRDYLILALGVLALGLETAYTAMHWSRLPAAVPTAFGAAGRPTAWGNRDNLLILPPVTLVLLAAGALASRYPRYFNYPAVVTEANARPLYSLGRLLVELLASETAVLLLVAQRTLVLMALGVASGTLPIVLLLVLITLTIVAFVPAFRRAGRSP